MYLNIYGNIFLCSLVKYSVVVRWGWGWKVRRQWLVVLWKVSLWSRGQTTPNTLALSCYACICIQQCISFVRLSSVSFNIVYKRIINSNKTVWTHFFISLQHDVWRLLGNSENYQCLIYESMSGKLRLSASAGCLILNVSWFHRI